MKKGKIERRCIGLRRCMNKRRLKEENTRENDMKQNLALAKENHCTLDSSGEMTRGKEKKFPLQM